MESGKFYPDKGPRLRRSSSVRSTKPTGKFLPLAILIVCTLLLLTTEIFTLHPIRTRKIRNPFTKGFSNGITSWFENGLDATLGDTAEGEDAAELGSLDEDAEDGRRRKLVWLSNEEECSHIVWGKQWKAGCLKYSSSEERHRPVRRKSKLDLRLLDVCSAHHLPYDHLNTENKTVRYEESDTSALLAVTPPDQKPWLVSAPSALKIGNTRRASEEFMYNVVGHATVVIPVSNQNFEALVSQFVKLTLERHGAEQQHKNRKRNRQMLRELPLTQHPELTPQVIQEISAALAKVLIDLAFSHRLAVRETEGGSEMREEGLEYDFIPGFSGFTVTFAVSEGNDGTKGIAIRSISSLADNPDICGITDIQLRDDILTLLWTKHIQGLEPIPKLNALVKVSDDISGLSSKLHFVSGYTLAKLAVQTFKSIPKKTFHIHQFPHFGGGRATIDNYMRVLGFTSARDKLNMKRMTGSRQDALQLTGASDVVFASCRGPTALWNAVGRGSAKALASFTPAEDKKTDKTTCFRSLERFFSTRGCDYRNYFPETIMADSKDACPAAIEFFKREVETRKTASRTAQHSSHSDVGREGTKEMVASSSSRWFGKTRMESFGRGIMILDDKAVLAGLRRGCPAKPTFRPYMIQRGIDDILLYKGRVTQARHYVVITSRNPYTVMYMDGYYNVASIEKVEKTSVGGDEASPSNVLRKRSTKIKEADRNKHLPNVHQNSSSRRLTQYDFEQYLLGKGRTEEELLDMRRRTKKLAMVVGLMYKEAYQTDKTIQGSKTGSFMIMGVDMVYDTQLVPRVLETNCNCELFNNVAKFGIARVELTRRLLADVLQVSLVTRFGRKEHFAALVRDWTESGSHNSMDDEELARPLFDNDVSTVDSNTNFRIRQSTSLKLLYTDAVEPAWQYTNLENGTC